MNRYRSETLEQAIRELTLTAEAAAIVGPAERQLRRISARHLSTLFTTRLSVYAEHWGSVVRRAIDVLARRVGYPHAVDHDELYALETWIANRQLVTGNSELDSDKWRALDQAYYAVREARKHRGDSPGTYAVSLACAVDDETRSLLAAWIAHAVSFAR